MKTIVVISRLLTCIVLCTASVQAQVTHQWTRRYNGTGNHTDQLTGMVLDAFGNVYATGSSSSSNIIFTEDYVTMKFSSAGDSVWAQRYNGTGNAADVPSDIAMDNYGNVYVTGYSTGSGTSSDYLTIKYSGNGVQQWVQRYNGPVTGAGQDVAYAIAVDAGGNVYITGVSDTSRVGATGNCVTIKYNTDGVQQWIAMYNGPGAMRDLGNDVAVDSDGSVYVTGYTTVTSTNLDYLTIKHDSSGNILWARTHNGTGNDRDIARKIAIDGEGNLYVTGLSRNSSEFYSEDYLTIKYNSTGDSVWTRRYDSPEEYGDEPQGMAVDQWGDVYVTGYGTNGATYALATVKYGTSGNLEWTEPYAGYAYANGLTLDSAGDLYVVGGINAGLPDCLITKLTSAGDEEWMDVYSDSVSLSDLGITVRVDDAGNVFVGGNSSLIHGATSNSDFLIIKYTQGPTEVSLSHELPSTSELHQNYPNPFNPSTTIGYSVDRRQSVVLKVYDLLGREVAALANEHAMPGSYSVRFDGTNLSSGTYFYRLTTGEQSIAKRLLLMK